MINQLDTLIQMSSPGPWDLKRTSEHKFAVLAGHVVVAVCDSAWDAELIVHLHNNSSHYQSIQAENHALHIKLEKILDIQEENRSFEDE